MLSLVRRRVANADMAELADAHGSATVTSVKNRGKSVDPHPVVRAGPKKAKKVANADMAELADAHGSDTVTSVKNRGESVHSRRAEESEKTCQRGYGGTGRRTGDLVAVQKSEKIFWNY